MYQVITEGRQPSSCYDRQGAINLAAIICKFATGIPQYGIPAKAVRVVAIPKMYQQCPKVNLCIIPQI